MYAVPHSGPIEPLEEFGNAWGGAIRIWNSLIGAYLTPASESQIEREIRIGRMMMGGFQEVWALGRGDRLKAFERLVLLSTYDKVIVEAARCAELAAAFREFDRVHPAGGVNHLPAMADVLDRIPSSVAGVCWQQTSVAEDQWTVRKGEDDSRLFDLARDANHGAWFMFEKLAAPDEGTEAPGE